MSVRLLRGEFKDPCRAFDFSNLGDIELKKGDTGGALAALNTAIEVESRWPTIWLHRSQAKLQHGDFEGAIADATTALELDGRITLAYASRGEARLQSGDALNAAADFDTFLAQEPTHAKILWRRSRARLELGRLREALADSQAALDAGGLTSEEQADCHLAGTQTHPAFDPGHFFAPDVSAKSMLHVQSADEAEDPGCESAEGWPEYRRQLLRLATEEWRDAAAFAFEWMNTKDMMKTKVMDEEAKSCLLGVITSLYFLAKYSLEEDGSWESAVYLMRSMSGYVSSLHPDKFDQITQNGQRWPVTVAELDSMRRHLASASQQRTTTKWKNSEGERFEGNVFGFQGSDDVEEGVSLRDSLKIYVYDVEEYPELQTLARGASFCRENQWGFEVSLHEWFLSCPCRTDDPLEADFFFVPHYTACHLNVETFTEAQSDELFKSLVQRLTHYRRSRGRDHVFVWGGGFGADGPFRSWRAHVEDAIFLMTETELWNPYRDISTPSFSQWKDILIPGRISVGEVVQLSKVTPKPASRQFLADFVGWNRPLHNAQGGLNSSSPRELLLEMANEPDLHIRQDVPYREATEGALSSRFCFVPRGKSAWSSRFFRVLFSDCVPVLLNDFYEPPYGEIFDSSGFTVRWPMRQVGPELLQALRMVSIESLEKMLEKAHRHRCWYVWVPAFMDHDNVDVQKQKLAKPCPRWRSENAFIGVMRPESHCSLSRLSDERHVIPQESLTWGALRCVCRTIRSTIPCINGATDCELTKAKPDDKHTTAVMMQGMRDAAWSLPQGGRRIFELLVGGEAVQVLRKSEGVNVDLGWSPTSGLAVGPESISKACTSALLLNPGLHEAMLVRGQAQLQLGFFAACELDCSDALKAIPNSATAWATRGRARLRQKSYREAADDCRQSLALDAQCRLAMSTLGAALLNLGDNQGALEYCDQAVHAMLDPKGEAEAKAQKKSKKKAGMSRNKDRKKFKERKTVSKIAASSASLATSATTEPEVTGEEMEMIEPGPEESEQRAEVETGQEQEQAPDSPVAESQDGEGGQEGNLLDAETSAVQVEAERDMDRSEIEELADLYTMLAQAKVALGDLDGTIEDCSRALQLNDRVPFCWAARAEAKRLQDKPDDAVADANEALRLDPLNVPAYITRAKAKLKAAHWQFVVTDCSEALALDLHQSSAWSTRAAARLELGDISGSVSDARSAITLDAENVAAWCTLGGALLDNLDIVASAEASSKAIGLDPGCARAWFNRGCARADLQDLEGARKDFDEVVKLWPESFMAFAHRAHIRLKQNDPEGALQDCEQALKLDKRLVRAMCTQAQIKRIMGDLKGAVSDATTALKYDPDCASAFSIRGQAYSKMEKHDKAVQDCQRAIKLDPPTLETPMLAWRHACASDPVPSPMTVWEFQALAAKMKQEAKAQAAAEAAAKWARKAKAAAAKKAEEEALRANMKKNRKSVR
ncbi:unnamed protein product [Symbiodinium microadriaticum]|nr:unnamed protein product [Symbiodinium microadriaticum]